MGRAEELYEKLKRDGEAAIDEFISTRQSEELFLDFKRSADNGGNKILHQNDRKNLAKALSGFGNSEGGVIVWGVDCSKDQDYADVARAKIPIQSPKRFHSWIEGSISGCTVPPVVGAENYTIERQDNTGFVVTYIPKSNQAPHQAVGEWQYYMRTGSSFSSVPHSVLAGMFGRRPQPTVYSIFNMYPAKAQGPVITCQIALLIRNQGPGIASDLFMNVFVLETPGDKCDLFFDYAKSDWMGQFTWGRHVSMICKPEVRLPPEAQLSPLSIHLTISPPFENNLEIELLCGCGQSPPHKMKMGATKGTIEKSFNEVMEKQRAKTLKDEDLQAFNKVIFGKIISNL